MSDSSTAPIPWRQLRNTLVLYAPLWVGATFLFGLMGLGAALMETDRWAARQPLTVRDEATGAVDRMGRFGSSTELKAAQETVLELAQNREVVTAALRQIGRPGTDPKVAALAKTDTDAAWPPVSIVESMSKKAVNVVAPQGSDFGGSEMMYLQTTADTPERAAAFCDALLHNLTEHMRTLRQIRADSVVTELMAARDLAKNKLDAATAQIREIEIRVGSDLGELRNLNDTIAGDGTSRRSMEEMAREQQVAELELARIQSVYDVLKAGSEDPRRLLIAGNDVLSSQPSLQRLKDGLVDAQLQTSSMVGIYTERHPRRRAAMKTEVEIAQRMMDESRSAIRAMQPTLKLAQQRVNQLQSKRDDLEAKLDTLAEVRTTYGNLDAQVNSLKIQLAEAESSLSDAEASRSAATSTSLIAALGPPTVSDQPEGMGAPVVAIGSTAAGLVFGLGAVFLIAPAPVSLAVADDGAIISGAVAECRTATPMPPPPPRPPARPNAAAGHGCKDCGIHRSWTFDSPFANTTLLAIPAGSCPPPPESIIFRHPGNAVSLAALLWAASSPLTTTQAETLTLPGPTLLAPPSSLEDGDLTQWLATDVFDYPITKALGIAPDALGDQASCLCNVGDVQTFNIDGRQIEVRRVADVFGRGQGVPSTR